MHQVSLLAGFGFGVGADGTDLVGAHFGQESARVGGVVGFGDVVGGVAGSDVVGPVVIVSVGVSGL